jgi:hypothetical protein
MGRRSAGKIQEMPSAMQARSYGKDDQETGKKQKRSTEIHQNDIEIAHHEGWRGQEDQEPRAASAPTTMSKKSNCADYG